MGRTRRDQGTQRSKRDPDQRKEHGNWNGQLGLCWLLILLCAGVFLSFKMSRG